MRPLRSRILLTSLLIVGIGTIGWIAAHRWLSSPRLPNVIVISIDTCRADHLSCYGHSGGMTPHMDAVARDGVLFENAISPVPLTLPAHCCMLTGTIPPSHGVHDNIAYRLADSHVTLGEMLGERGYRTGAIIGAAVLDSGTGLSQGFDMYDDQVGVTMTQAGARPERRGGQVSWLANEWLDAHTSEPFFLFVHFFDPHDPYDPPEPFATRFAGDPYAGEVAYVDECVGKVIEKLKRLGLYDFSLIVIVGDHGEGLGEHGEPTHGYFVYHSTTKVPMIIKRPDGDGAIRVADAVSLTDIVPTVLGQIGAPIPPGLSGEDLSARLAGKRIAPRERFLYSESMTATRFGCSPLLGIETGSWKYIQTSRPELYELTSDPSEQHNVVRDHPKRARAMRAQLESILSESLGLEASGQSPAVSSEHLDRLRALGYTGGTIEESFEFDAEREDPKDFITFYLRIQAIDECRIRDDRAGAKRIAEGLLAERPDIVQIRRTLARFAMEDGDDETAIFHYTKLLTLAPDSDEAAAWHNNLGTLLERQGRLDKAMEHYREAIRLAQSDVIRSDPASRSEADRTHTLSVIYSAHLNLGSIFLRKGDAEAAMNEYFEATRVRPADATAHAQLGVALAEIGRLDEAIEHLQACLRLDPQHPFARRELDSALARRATLPGY